MKILLLDTNVSSFPIYAELKKHTNEVYVCGNNETDFLANIAGKNYIKLDYSDSDILINHIQEKDYYAIVPGCNDISYLSCAKIKNNNPNVLIDDIEKADILFNKENFRCYSLSRKLPVPQIYDFENIADAKGKILVKPVDAYSGRGISVIENKGELENAVMNARNYSLSKKCLVEEYIVGNLYSHTAFISGGKIIHDFVVAEYGSANEFVVDTSYVDFSFEKNILKEIRECIEFIVNDLKLQDGLLHTQFICNDDKFWLIELTRRCPGDLYSRLIQLSSGFQYAKMYIDGFLGNLRKSINENGKNYILRHTISTDREQDFYSINCQVPVCMIDYISLAKSGERIKKSPFGRVGVMFLKCANERDMYETKDLIMQRKLYSLSV
ncbi:ATP-grasp domain-containing protein [Oxalobacter formigenes]|jgi:hypothetical protein|uniref:ATP-grasp domain-containing protein n=1 Tax=Oxalobacter formigenes OXCC13 TaxID=556269 RepID=C3X8L1_OXAFO|nr:ATP-grasp domain-containing protein [Oxalobacter formigenes]ARQ46417.1 carbamoyl phosphate synthase-like protein [Oxalobacter formigenes]ARQ78523.1 hypothetical protein BRW84_07825 [Oxalobacter formigenes OXCC13]EEO29537.1 hypothetical protein OFBG_00565 [Oxalobacter formigenes OXCC13]MCZ4063732.1 ATP-grasp domain-containing protein [Oxalobacter formigenes]QDX32900.1 ATP-grasp domain-containing protein [Oxalobacter formigenes]